jgi:hypothetical protein
MPVTKSTAARCPQVLHLLTGPSGQELCEADLHDLYPLGLGW